MPQIILGPGLDKIDGSLQKATYAFLAKLAKSDQGAGLHIEPINGSADPRARTGRVDLSNRAVLFKIQGSGADASYIFAGTYPHDEAIEIARKSRMDINARNGIAELIPVDPAPRAPAPPRREPREAPAPARGPRTRSLREREYTEDYLTDLGFDSAFAAGALDLREATELLDYAESAPAAWQGHALVDLFTGESIAEVRGRYRLEEAAPVTDGTADDRLLAALAHPAAKMEFAVIDDDNALREAIENPSFTAWRIFLHPAQRALTTRNFNGPARITGGAGTGKTVVLIHRARELARRNPRARIVLTTFNKTLAEALATQIRLLDPQIPITEELGTPGIFVASVDSIAHRAITGAGNLAGNLAGTEGDPGPVVRVLGPRTAQIRSTRPGRWQAAADQAGESLPRDLTTPGFLETEYAMVVLPNSLTTETEYLKVRRPGRGVALNRARRRGVWHVFSAYRARSAAEGTVDFEEKAAIAARVLEGSGALVDHLLVDEAQDLSPSRFQLLRALTAEGPNDLFIAEDAHQRIYGHKLVLSHFGINVRGRATRLTLNYRTTEQNLRFALRILQGQEFTDISGEVDSVAQYRSARTGPVPELIPVTSLAAEYARVGEIVTAWLAEGIAADSIGLLVATRSGAENLVRVLGERALRVAYIDRDSAGKAGLPQVMTMHRSKGMEFARVVLVGVGAANVPRQDVIDALPEGDRDDALQRERSLLYVAATRARDRLVVIWTGEGSPLLSEQPDHRVSD